MFLGGGEQGGDKDDIVDDGDDSDSNADANNELSGGAEAAASQEAVPAPGHLDSLSGEVGSDVKHALEKKQYSLEVLKEVDVVIVDDDDIVARSMKRQVGAHVKSVTVWEDFKGKPLSDDQLLSLIGGLEEGTLVVTDFNMTSRTGVEVAETVALNHGDKICIVIASGIPGQEGIQPLVDDGTVQGFFNKSSTNLPQFLANVYGAWLEKRKAQTE